MNSWKLKNNTHGFTIVEIVTTMFIVGIIAIGVASLFAWGFRLWRVSDQQSRAHEQAQKAFEQIIKELREAQTASNGAYPIESATAAQLIFYTNTDADDDRERVRITLSGTSLIKGVIQPTGSPATYPQATETTTTITPYVRNTGIFSYYDQQFTGTQNPLTFPVNVNLVRLVQISILVDIDPNQSPDAFELESYVTVRNLKQNL